MTRATLLACCRLAQEREDYRQIAHEYDFVIRKLEAENERIRAALNELMGKEACQWSEMG